MLNDTWVLQALLLFHRKKKKNKTKERYEFCPCQQQCLDIFYDADKYFVLFWKRLPLHADVFELSPILV